MPNLTCTGEGQTTTSVALPTSQPNVATIVIGVIVPVLVIITCAVVAICLYIQCM